MIQNNRLQPSIYSHSQHSVCSVYSRLLRHPFGAAAYRPWLPRRTLLRLSLRESSSLCSSGTLIASRQVHLASLSGSIHPLLHFLHFYTAKPSHAQLKTNLQAIWQVFCKQNPPLSKITHRHKRYSRLPLPSIG